MDVHSPEQRRFNMSRIKGRNTRPEMMIRRWLWAKGYRYRLHRKELPGKPDIVLSRYHTAIFIHGCFWHRHGCRATATPESRRDFWLAKFRENVNRDKRNIEALMNNAWRVIVIWECALRGETADMGLITKQLSDFLRSDIRFAESVADLRIGDDDKIRKNQRAHRKTSTGWGFGGRDMISCNVSR